MKQKGIITNNYNTVTNCDSLIKCEYTALNQHSGQSILQDAEWFGMPMDKWVRHIISIHFDPVDGSQYWLQREKMLGINARKDIVSLDDLHILGPMEEEDLRRYPLEYFIPIIYLVNKDELILGETAGTTGLPKVTAYLKNEFYMTFVEWFR